MTIEEAVFQALGEASMAWSETPTGVFDTTRIMTIGNELIALIKEAN
jgi:hypothetical protein